MLDLARQGRVLLPLRPPHSLMVFYTLAANLGHALRDRSDPAISSTSATGSEVFETMREIAALIDPACFDMDPIAASERMARGGFARSSARR